MSAAKAICLHCGAVLDPDGEGVPAHPAPVCETFMAEGGIRYEAIAVGPATCHFWDIRARECRYEMLFLGCEPCKACPG